MTENLPAEDLPPLVLGVALALGLATLWFLHTVGGANAPSPSLFDNWDWTTFVMLWGSGVLTLGLVSVRRGPWLLVPTIPLRYVSHRWGWPLVVVQCWVTGLIWGLVLLGLTSGSPFTLDNVATGLLWTALLWGPAMLVLPGEMPDAGRDAWSERLRRAPASWDQFCRGIRQEAAERGRRQQAKGARGAAEPPPTEPSPEPMGVAEAVAFFDLAAGYTRADVKASYRRLSLRWHPDTGIPDDRMMRRINAANALLVAAL